MTKFKKSKFYSEYIKGFKTNPNIKRIRTELKPKYIINFNQMTQLKQMKTYITEIKTIQHN